jgi:hypothetical protein
VAVRRSLAPGPRSEVVTVPYYELTVSGRPDLEPSTIAAETGLPCARAEGVMRLVGELVDRAALHGAITRIYRLGLELRAVERRPEPSHTVITS